MSSDLHRYSLRSACDDAVVCDSCGGDDRGACFGLTSRIENDRGFYFGFYFGFAFDFYGLFLGCGFDYDLNHSRYRFPMCLSRDNCVFRACA